MFEGHVLDIIDCPWDGVVWISCAHRDGGSAGNGLYLERDDRAQCIVRGDLVSWHDDLTLDPPHHRYAYWTPASAINGRRLKTLLAGRDFDLEIVRVGDYPAVPPRIVGRVRKVVA